MGKFTYLCHSYIRADSRFVPSQWETALLCNDVSHWLGASLESALYITFLVRWIHRGGGYVTQKPSKYLQGFHSLCTLSFKLMSLRPSSNFSTASKFPFSAARCNAVFSFWNWNGMMTPGPWYKDRLSQVWDSHVKDKTVTRSLYWSDDIFILKWPPGHAFQIRSGGYA